MADNVLARDHGLPLFTFHEGRDHEQIGAHKPLTAVRVSTEWQRMSATLPNSLAVIVVWLTCIAHNYHLDDRRWIDRFSACSSD